MYTPKREYRPGDEPVPHYHLVKFLGEGQFGAVWQAKGPGGMQVALKMIRLADREGLKEFAGLQKVKDIRHANLVEFVACWVKTEDNKILDEVPADSLAALGPRDSGVEIGGTMLFDAAAAPSSRPVELIVAMSLGSKTLFRRLQEINQGKPQAQWSGIPEAELLDYMEQAARGIDFLNQQGIIHGDIKPQNLLIVGNSLKVCDFGLAQAVDSLRKTQSGMGTVAYAAPELFEGKPHLRSDQYCLAISYVELRTGSLPFDEANPFKVIDLHRQGRLDLARLSPSERKIIRRATQLKPDKRWPSCLEMVSRLRECQRPASRKGFWSSLFGDRPLPPEGSPLPEVEALDEPVEAESGGKPGSQGERAATPGLRSDATRRKSDRLVAVHDQLGRTHPQRRDDTDGIAATLPSSPLPAPAARRSWAGRLLKTTVALGALAAIVWAAYPLLSSLLDRHDNPPEPSPAAVGLLESAKREYRKAVEAGDFDKAADVVADARKSLSAEDYLERFEPEVRKAWSTPSTNPVLRQFRDEVISLHEAIIRLTSAETNVKFVERVGAMPEEVWQACLDELTKDFVRYVLDGKWEAAVQMAAQARRTLNVDRYQQWVERLRKTWLDPATHPILVQLRQDAIPIDQAYLRLKKLGGVEAMVKLVGPVPPGVWQALADAWHKRFEPSVAADLAAAVTLWEAVGGWEDVPTEAISPRQRADWKRRLEEQWKKQTEFAERIAKNDFRGVRRELEQPLAKRIFDTAALEGLRKGVQPQWTAYFDGLIQATEPEKLVQAAEELKDLGLFFDGEPEYKQKASHFGNRWRASVRDLAKTANWSAVKTLFEAGKEIVPQEEHKAALDGALSEFDHLLEPHLKDPADAKKLEMAETMLAGVERLEIFPPAEIERRREKLHSLSADGNRKMREAEFRRLVDGKKWEDALKMLDAPAVRQWLKPDDVPARRADVCRKWLQTIYSLGEHDGQEEKLLAECDAFLKLASDPSGQGEARLLRARALLRLGRAEEAKGELQALEGLAQDQGRLRDALVAIAAKTPRDPKEFASLPAPWKLSPWEEQQLQGMVPPPKPDDSPVAIIRKALEAVKPSQPTADLVGPLLDALEKHFPPSAPERWKVDNAEDVGLLSSDVPGLLEKLASAAGADGRPAYERQGRDLARATAWLLAARDKYRRPKLGAAALATATARLAFRVWEPTPPGEAERLREIQEWEELSKGRAAGVETGVADLMARAWRVESLLSVGRDVATAANALALIHKDLKDKARQPAYADFLSCLAMRAEGAPWDDLMPGLLELAPAVERREPILQGQGRAAAVAEWIVQAAADRRRRSRPWKLEKIPFNPFGSPAEAEQYAGLLKAAGVALGDQSGLQLEWKRSRVLAEFHRPQAALGDAWTLAREVPASPDAGADPDAVPLGYAAASSFWKQPAAASWIADDPQGAAGVDFTVRLLRALSDDAAGDFSPDGLKAFRDAVVDPMLKADFLGKAKAASGVAAARASELAGALAEFLDHHQHAPWPAWPEPFQDIHDAIVRLASAAIEGGSAGKVEPGRLGDFYALRAKAHTYRSDFDPDMVLADVEAALKHGPTRPYVAHGARAYALLERAGQRDKREDLLRDLKEAIAAAEEAVKGSAGRPRLATIHALNLAVAHLRRGNYETEGKEKEKHFTAARDTLTQQAAQSEQALDEEGRLLLGNLHEDFASQLDESPRENYQEALRQFSEVLRQNSLSAQALLSRARCAYKALRGGVEPQLLGLGDRDAALDGCIRDLNRALSCATCDSHRIEAHYYLGQVYEMLGDSNKADEHVGSAAKRAIDSNAAGRAAPIARWAELALRHAKRLREQQRNAADPEERKRLEAEIDKRLQAAEQRAEILRAAPIRGFQVPGKIAALILGETWRMRKDYDRAIAAYDAAMGDPRRADAGDVPLLLARAQCNLERFNAQKPSGAKAKDQASQDGKSFAESAIRDSTRARTLAVSPMDQAEAGYQLALGYFVLFRSGGDDALKHRDQFLEAIRSAVKTAVSRSQKATFRHTGATMILTVVLDWYERIDKNDQQALADFPKQTLPFLEEARLWAKEALDWEQDPGRRKQLQDLSKLLEDRIEEYRKAALGQVPNE